jgi:hypothetical protein
LLPDLPNDTGPTTDIGTDVPGKSAGKLGAGLGGPSDSPDIPSVDLPPGTNPRTRELLG